MVQFDIYQVKHLWNTSEDIRPWLVVGGPYGNVWDCFPISSHCYGGHSCFEIDPKGSGFKATGLTRACFIHFQSMVEIPEASFLKRKGALTGELLARFREEAGC